MSGPSLRKASRAIEGARVRSAIILRTASLLKPLVTRITPSKPQTITNESAGPAVLLPEEAEDPLTILAPGTTLTGCFDGFALPDIRPEQAFKLVDGVSARITPSAEVRTTAPLALLRTAQALIGGWYGPGALPADWDRLFIASAQKKVP